MKILQINNVYDRLSTGKIVADLHNEYIKNGYESYVCYARGPLVSTKNVRKFNWEWYAKFNKIRGFVTGVLYGGNFFSTIRLQYYIKKISPDIVHIHCINDNSVNIYKLLRFLKRNKIKVVITNHAEFYFTGNCGYSYECEKWETCCGHCSRNKTLFDNSSYSWHLMGRAFEGFNINDIIITSVSPWLTGRSKRSPFLRQYKHETVLNGIDISRYYYHDKYDDVISKYNLDRESSYVLFVTSSFLAPAKGGKFLLEIANCLPNINFLVLGEKGHEVEIPSNIKLLGRIYDREIVAKLYSLCNATLVLSKAETFSMPVAESLCCGTTVVGFKAGGPESICLEDYCKFVDYGDVNSLQKALSYMLSQSFDREKISREAILKYSKKAMAGGYIAVYNSLMRNA